MFSSTSQVFLSVVGWSYIPSAATSRLLPIFHHILSTYIRPGTPPPKRGSQAYATHFRYTYTLVVLSYLSYNLIQSARSMTPNFYQILGVPPGVDETGLKAAFRQFAKKYHPDRPEVGRQGEEMFMMVRDVFEALKNPVVRFAYDRFGPDVLSWSQCSTTREYLRHGLMQSSGYHIVAGAGLLFWSAIGSPSPVAFWRYLLFASLFVFELGLILSPSPSTSPSTINLLISDPVVPPTHLTLLHVIFPNRVAFQHILFLHQLFVFLSIALSRVAPQLFPVIDDSHATRGLIERVRALSGIVDRETSSMIHTELHSIHPETTSHVSLSRMQPLTAPSPQIIDALSNEMEKMVIEGNVKREVGPIRAAWETAIRRGRRGTRGPTTPKNTPPRIKQFWERGDEEGINNSRGSHSTVSPLPKLSPSKVHPHEGGRLPSPRPSPSPSSDRVKEGSGYVRARSLSY